MTDQQKPRRSMRVARPRPGDAEALRRLAVRLGENPDAARRRAAPQWARDAESLSVDPERRAEAALAKCEGLLAGRAAGRRLLAMAEEVSGDDDAGALEAALRIAGEGEAGAAPCGCPHRAAGYRSGLAPILPEVAARLSGRRAAIRRERLLAALRELLADEIEERRLSGAAASEAASVLMERLDLRQDLPVTAADLAGIGRSIAEEASPDPELAAALGAVAAQIEATAGGATA